MAALKALRGGTRPESFAAWIHVIVRNTCTDAARRRPDTVPIDDAVSRLTDETAYEVVLKREQLRAVVADINTLPASQRRTLIARELAGRSYQQLADDHGTTVPAVKSCSFARATRCTPALTRASSPSLSPPYGRNSRPPETW